ncbi:MAG: orotate phosphoribosyltransferase [Candidatus Eisenbacteria bacterium]|nr:orotate phosphoribosyltransferase [Candidatus Eisenbacteria bacterium]
MEVTTAERTLEILRETKAIADGHFILRSGRHSGRYCQCMRALERPEYAEELGKMIADMFRGERIDVVLTPALGGILIGHEVARALGVRSVFAERKEDRMELRRGFALDPGERVLIVEDVVTTGGAVREVSAIAREAGAELVGFGFIVDRSNGEVDLGAPARALCSVTIESYEPSACPLCASGESEPVKPGSSG